MRRLAELDQHAARALRVEEGDGVAVRAVARRLVDEPHAGRAQPRQLGGDVLDAVGGVVQFVAASPRNFAIGEFSSSGRSSSMTESPASKPTASIP